MTNNELLGGAYALGRDSLRNFSILTDRDYRPAWLHDDIAEKLEAVERGEIKRLIIEVPPRHGKTQLATMNFPAWYLGRHPDKEIIVSAYSEGLAQDFGSKTRDIVSSDEFRAIFPTIGLKADTQSKVKWATAEGGSYTSVGIGGALTGRGADLLIIDDPIKNREEAESEVIRKKIWDWYTSTARTRLEKGAAVIVIMTRWHLFDLVGLLIEAEGTGGEKWHRVTYPAISTHQEAYRAPGEALWPEKYDVQALNAIRNTVGERDWLALFQQTPVASDSQDFRQEFFRYFEQADADKLQLDYYTGVDLAISQKDAADNVVIRTVGKERNKPNIYLIEETAGKLDPTATIEAIFMHYEKYKSIRIGIETVAYQQALVHFLQEEQRRRNVYFNIQEIRSTAQKEIRIRSLVPMYKAGVVFHRHSDKALESELLQFPQGKHDDRIDALQFAVQLTAPTEYHSKIHREQSFEDSFVTY